MDSRISANMTGIDTDSIVQQLMLLERRPLVRLQAQQSVLDSHKSAWSMVGTQINAVSARLDSLLKSSAFAKMGATATDPDVLAVSVSDDAVAGSYDIEVLSLAKAQTVQSKGFSAQDEAGILKAGEITLNGHTIAVDSEDTLQSIAQKINGTEDIGVRASVLKTSDNEYRLALTATKTGAAGVMSFEDDADGWQDLGVVDTEDGVNVVVAAVDASFTIEGISFTRSENRISDAISGVTLDFSKVGKTNVKVSLDDKAVISEVKSFVSDYNNLVDTVKRLSSWDPDAKKGGVLFGDSLVTKLLQDVRQAVFAQVDGAEGAYSSLGAIGISTGASGAFSRDGKLSLDETALKTALETDREGVAALLTHDDYGVFGKLQTLVKRYGSSTGLVSGRQDQIKAQDKFLSRQIETMQARLDKKMDSLRKRFLAMELALQRLNTQSMWLSQQLDSISTSSGAGG